MAKKKAETPAAAKAEQIKHLKNGKVLILSSDGSWRLLAEVASSEDISGEVSAPAAASDDDDDEASDEGLTRAEMEKALVDSGEFTKKDLKKMDDEEVEEAYESLGVDDDSDDDEEAEDDSDDDDDDDDSDDDDDEEVSREDMEAALLESGEYTKKDLKKMDDEEVEEAYEALEDDDDDDSDDDGASDDDEDLEEMSEKELRSLAGTLDAPAKEKKKLKDLKKADLITFIQKYE